MSNDLNYARVQNNLEALYSLKSKQPHPEKLKKYSGWGGLRKAVYTPMIFKEMKKFLSSSEILSLKSTLNTAYYTPKHIVEGIYSILMRSDCKPKKILDPAVGSGVFIECMPESIRKDAIITAVEIDNITCRLFSSLYPGVKIHQMGFEQFNTNEKFDLIVGNPPFGKIYVKDKVHADICNFSIHHYFVAKGMRLLNQNGILAMVLPRYFMDARLKHVREIISNEGGSLLAAYRLPDDLFDNATVTIDIVFLKRSRGNLNWLNAVQINDGNQFSYMNDYFVRNPNHIRGDIQFFKFRNRTEITCKRKSL